MATGWQRMLLSTSPSHHAIPPPLRASLLIRLYWRFHTIPATLVPVRMDPFILLSRRPPTLSPPVPGERPLRGRQFAHTARSCFPRSGPKIRLSTPWLLPLRHPSGGGHPLPQPRLAQRTSPRSDPATPAATPTQRSFPSRQHSRFRTTTTAPLASCAPRLALLPLQMPRLRTRDVLQAVA